MFTLIENGEVYGPEPLGHTSVLLANSKICKVGEVDATILERLDLPLEVIDASGCVVTPGKSVKEIVAEEQARVAYGES
ncbi:MAG TPA: hypothetical protein VF088_21625 [Pyrinomonadaceae bacterium]